VSSIAVEPTDVLHSPPATDDTNRLPFSFLLSRKKCIITNFYIIVPTLQHALFELLPGEPCKEKRLPHAVAVGMVDDQKRFSILITCLICRYADRSRFEKSSAYNADEPVDLVKSQIRHERSIVIIATIIIFLWKIG